MVHDIIEIHADAEAMRRFDHLEQLIFGAVFGGHRAALVFIAEIKSVELIVPDRIDAATFAGRRQPQAGVPGLGDLRHLLD